MKAPTSWNEALNFLVDGGEQNNTSLLPCDQQPIKFLYDRNCLGRTAKEGFGIIEPAGVLE